MLERLMTLKEVAQAVRLSDATLRRAVRAGYLEVVRAGRRGQIRVEQSALDAYLRGKSEPAATPSPSSSAVVPVPGLLRERLGVVETGQTYRIVTADARAGLAALPAGAAQCAVTSPPYFWQRDYNVVGQIGKEPTIQAYIDDLVSVFRELKRVLAKDGTFFLNLGDGFYNAKGKPHGSDPKHSGRMMARRELRAVDGPGLGLPRKSLIGMPWRVALALQADGWVLRSAIVWNRPGSLCEPTGKDRPSRSYEMVFMFSQTQKYFFDRAGLVPGEEDIWTIRARPENPHSHAAPFPVELVDRCLACGCPPEGTVLDPFVGSGTTIVSALRRGRSGIGIELNDGYAEQAEERILSDAAKRAAKNT
jgi:excisionase family DNA binding protein